VLDDAPTVKYNLFHILFIFVTGSDNDVHSTSNISIGEGNKLILHIDRD
jgi:hypothetical protein